MAIKTLSSREMALSLKISQGGINITRTYHRITLYYIIMIIIIIINTCEIKSRTANKLDAFNKKRALLTSTLDLKLRKKLVKWYIWSIALYGAETWTLRAVDHDHLESFQMWCWRRMEKISWTDHVRNEEVLVRVKEQRNILHEISKRKANWIGHIMRRNCLLQWVTEGKIKGGIEVRGR